MSKQKDLAQTCKVHLTGTAPYLMHNVRLANPLDPYTKAMKVLTGKRDKTDEDHENVMHQEFLGGLYWNEQNSVYVPARQIEASLLVAARTKKLGKQVQRGVWILQEELPMEHKGPKDPEELYANPIFVDVRSVRIGGKRISRTRPIFRQWGLVCEFIFDAQVMNPADLEECLRIAGRLIGVGELRPRYGRFDVEVIR